MINARMRMSPCWDNCNKDNHHFPSHLRGLSFAKLVNRETRCFEGMEEEGEGGSNKNVEKFLSSSLASHVHNFVKMIIGFEE
ncbi:hypothetical protein V6N11_034153 [Hibiscus sabdariffa]|uniref:Uncharacterized protein n=1 Tax=Hibiscus sabdariffa TaxID=183260 RepID=A0ABR2S2F3_9ROSI